MPDRTLPELQEITQPDKGPFVHKFRTERHWYIYDVNSNRVFQVGPLVYELVDRPELQDLASISKAFPNASPDEVANALDEVCKATSEGWLSWHRPTGLSFSPGRTLQEEIAGAQCQQLILNVTEECNLRCGYCIYSGNYNGQRMHSKRVMDLGLACKAIDAFMNNAKESVYISFYGGEPLIRFNHIKEIIGYTEASWPLKKINWSMTTNGVLVTPEIARYLMEKKVLVTISLDGPQAVHDRHRKEAGGRGSFLRVMRSLEMLREADPAHYNETLQFSIVCAPPFDFAETERFFDNHELTRGHQCSFSYVNSATSNSDLQPSPIEVERLDAEYLASRRLFLEGIKNGDRDSPASFAKSLYEKDFHQFYCRSKTPLGEEMYPNGCCVPSAQRLFVSVDGSLHICEKLDSVYPIGSVENWVDRSAVGLFFDEYLNLSRDCTGCWACRLCSLCFFSFISHGVFCAERRAFECRSVRRRWDRVLREYCAILEEDMRAFDYLAEIGQSVDFAT